MAASYLSLPRSETNPIESRHTVAARTILVLAANAARPKIRDRSALAAAEDIPPIPALCSLIFFNRA